MSLLLIALQAAAQLAPTLLQVMPQLSAVFGSSTSAPPDTMEQLRIMSIIREAGARVPVIAGLVPFVQQALTGGDQFNDTDLEKLRLIADQIDAHVAEQEGKIRTGQ